MGTALLQHPGHPTHSFAIRAKIGIPLWPNVCNCLPRILDSGNRLCRWHPSRSIWHLCFNCPMGFIAILHTVHFTGGAAFADLRHDLDLPALRLAAAYRSPRRSSTGMSLGCQPNTSSRCKSQSPPSSIPDSLSIWRCEISSKCANTPSEVALTGQQSLEPGAQLGSHRRGPQWPRWPRCQTHQSYQS